MTYVRAIGTRYLQARKKASISAITLIAVLGVALGVAALSVVIAISSGFEDEFTQKVLGVNSHVLVMKYGVDFTEYRDVMRTAKAEPGVRGVAPFIIQEMMISHGERTAGVLLKGIDPQEVGQVLDLPRHLVAGSLAGLRVPSAAPARNAGERRAPAPVTADAPLPGIVLGRTLAENLGAKVGDTVQVLTPLIGLDILGWKPSEETPRSLAFRVTGVFYAGFLEYDTKLVYVDLWQAQRFFDHGDSVTGIELTVHDIHRAKEIARSLRATLGGGPFHTVDWQLLNEPLFTALKMQKIVLTIVLAVIVGVAAFNIIATLVMLVFDKRKEIAILRSMGASRAAILRIFVFVGLVVGIVGIALGLALGLGVCLLLTHVGWPLDPKVYLIDHLPVRIELVDFAVTAGVAFAICLLATVWPSWSAARLKPVDGLRLE